MKKILFAIYAKYSYDARALETIEALSRIGELTVVSIDDYKADLYKHYTTKNCKRDYIQFRRCFWKAFNEVHPDVVFLHDNYCAPFIKKIRKKNTNIIILYDSSELYCDKRYTNLKTYFGVRNQRIEENSLYLTDGIFAANIERALIMHDLYGLKTIPTVFDNVHRIDESVDETICSEKYDAYVANKKVILYCGGISEKRRTYELIKAVEEIGNPFTLIIAGAATDKEIAKYQDLLNKSAVKNFIYIGYITRSEIKYLLHKSFASVSLFDFSCVNNIFCASGKVYESLFEGTPILTSTNPPLQRLCNNSGVGVSVNDLKSGIEMLDKNYEYYHDNVLRYRENAKYDERVDKLKEDIECFIHNAEIKHKGIMIHKTGEV